MLADAYGAFQAVVGDELEGPLHPHTLDELKWYFGQLRAMPNARIRSTDERFERAAEAFERPRFYRLYRQWLKDGDSVLDSVSSTVISHALMSGAGGVECLILPHRYDHLSPLVASVGTAAGGAEKGAERTDQRGEQTPAPSRPPQGAATQDLDSPGYV